ADGSDTFDITSDVDANITLDKASATRGTLTAVGMGGSVDFEGVSSADVNLADGDDTVTILDTATPVTVNAGGGSDTIFVHAVSQDLQLNLGADDDQVTVYGTGMPLTVDGSGGGSDTLTVDRSGSTAALSASITDGTSLGQGVVSGLTVGDVTFQSMARVNVLLGDGNDNAV
ncbi:MAG: hypothetical protein KDJ77_07870, partial [Rhodobiaceae bacterium]|nr:hypothetical protein [Rhodobiaceae bacterium]